MKRIVKEFSVVILTIVMAASLSGCRVSPALIDPVYTADASEIDPNQIAAESTEDAEAENDSNSQTRETDGAEDYNTESDKSVAIQDEQADESTPSHKTGNDATKNEQFKKMGNSRNGELDSGGAMGENLQNRNGGGAQDESDKEDEESSDNQDNSSGKNNSSEPPVKNVPKKVVTDASGIEQLIPEDVYTVTAVGAAAPIVAMVGGAGRLVGTSESFAFNEIGSMILASEPDTQVNTWWSGDGSGQISEDNFAQLLETSPDVCFEISGESTFSSEQITQLKEYGIGYLSLPALSSSENLKDAVMIMAKALETNESTGQAASVVAQQYCEWVDEVLANADKNRKDLDYYSIYISEWRDDIQFQRRFAPGYDEKGFIVDFPASSGVVDGVGQGVAIASTDVVGKPIFEFWKAAGVRDTAVEKERIADVIVKAQSLGYTGMYIFPYMNEFGTPTFSDSNYYFPTDSVPGWSENLVDFIYPFTWGLTWPDGKLGDSFEGLKNLGGSERFSAIVVADDYVKSKISNSPQWKAGFLEGVKDIAGDYMIYVNPTGLNNWAEGSVESPLETYWVLNKISGAMSEEQLKKEVKNFYLKFFDITLSPSQIDNIINR